MKSRLLACFLVFSAFVSPVVGLEIKSDARPGALPKLDAPGEIAINRADGRLFYRDEAGNRIGTLLPDLDASSYLKFRNGLTLGRYQGGRFISKPDVLDAGSVLGDGSGARVKALGGSVFRSFAERARDNLSVRDFGAKCDGVTDDREAFQKAADVHFAVGLPDGRCMIDGTVYVSTGTQFQGKGQPQHFQFQGDMRGTILDYSRAPAGSNGFESVTTVAATTTAAAASVNSATLTVASPTGVSLGQIVRGAGIPVNTIVMKVAGSTVTLSKPAAVASGAALTFRATEAAQQFRLADMQIQRAPAAGAFVSMVYGQIERVSFSYNGEEGLFLYDTYLSNVSKSLAQFNGQASQNSPGISAIATGTFTTLTFTATESMWNKGDGYYIENFNSVSLFGSAGDRNTRCGIRARNSYVALYSTDVEHSGLTAYCPEAGSNFLMASATAAANNTTNAPGEANFLKAVNSKVSASNSYDIAPSAGVPSSLAQSNSEVIFTQSPMQAAVVADATSYAGTPVAPGKRTNSASVGGPNTVTGPNGVAVGTGNTANGSGSISMGIGATDRGATGTLTFGSGAAQTGTHLLVASTAATSATTLTKDGGVPTAATCIPLPLGSAFALNGTVTARMGSGDVVTYNVTGALAYRGGGSVALAGGGTWVRGGLTGGFSAQTAPSVIVDTKNQCAAISVTPASANSTNWVARLTVDEAR